MYTKSIQTDFSGSFHSFKFHEEVKVSSISANFMGVNVNGDIVEIMFSQNIDETILNSLIANHDSTSEPLFYKTFSIGQKKEFSESFYEIYSDFAYPGKVSVGKINEINILANGVFTVKIFDKTNIKILAEKTFNLSGKQIHKISSINNIPNTESDIEVQVKTSSSVLIYNVCFNL